ncbi:MAG: DNA-binding protein WhiA [Clostridia bacterium]|nr:DNA-binding protein WhiA [Clostridia bacterium]
MSFNSEIKDQLIESIPKKDCCKRALSAGFELEPLEQGCQKDIGCYLRGVFLKCGNISSPGRNFMLSLTLNDKESTDMISDLLDSLSLPAKRTVRKGKPVLYYKASESIEDFLSYIGATKAALEIMNAKIMSGTRNTANRLTNAETANLDRMARAAAEQRESILIIQQHGAMDNLPPELRECAELRLANPDMSLSQLRELLREPVSKSGLNHRFKKLQEIAETLQSQ